MRILAGLFLIGAFAHAQPGCPPVSFQTAVLVNPTPSASSRLVFVRQSDGSYAAYEMADASPYQILQTTPKFGSGLLACLPKESALPPLVPPQTSGASAQTEVFAQLTSGAYLDIQYANDWSYAINAYVFDASMTLLSQTRVGISYLPPQFTMADVNGDGNLDLIALITYASGWQDGIDVFLGNGDGTFQPPIQTLVAASGFYVRVTSFAAADVNGDGKTDLMLGIGSPPFPGNGSVMFMAGNGDGTFQGSSDPLSANVPYSVTLADLNGDGKPDVVFSDVENNGNSVVTVALGAGDGSFGTPVQYPAAAGISGYSGYGAGFAVGDIDGDGNPDIVCTGITILFGDGSGAFPRRADYLSEAGGNIVLTDLDGDGRMDIVAGVNGNPLVFTGNQIGGTGNISVLFGRGDGLFRGPPVSAVPPLGPDTQIYTMATADFDNDGISDLAVVDEFQLAILRGSSAGTFTTIAQYPFTTGEPVDVVTADLNRDGKPDLAVSFYTPGQDLVDLFLGNGDGTFQQATPITLSAGLVIASLAVGDFNGDGKPDLAVLVTTQGGGAADEVLVYLGNGDGSFQSPVSYATGGAAASAIAAGDFNNDGRLDLAIANYGAYGLIEDGSVTLLLGKGDGTFSPGTPIPVSGPVGIAAADLNGDGKLDVVVTLSTGNLAVLLGGGDGSFQPPVVYPATGPSLAIGDLNGDRIPDLIVSGVNAAGYLLGNGDGTFAPETQFADYVGPLVLADFNRDGKLDLAGGVEPFDAVVTFLNTSPTLLPVRGRYHWPAGN